MPTYHVEVNLEITSPAGRRPLGGAILAQEVQLVQVYCKYRCAQSTVISRARAIARQNALDALVAYSITAATVKTGMIQIVQVT